MMMKYLMLSLLLTFSLTVLGQNDTLKNTEEDEIWLGAVTKEARFKGDKTLAEFINKNLSSEVKKFIADKKIKGKFFYSFIVDKKGKLIDVKLETGELDSYVDTEFIRVIKLTEWEPAIVHETRVS